MRRVLLPIVFLLIYSAADAQVPTNVLYRVFRIECGELAGSAFTFEVDGQQYVVTARHNLEKCDPKIDVKLFLDGAWRPFKARAIYPSCSSVDIIALDVGQKVTVDFPLEPTAEDIFLGQQVYFVGYPSGLGTRGGLPSGVAEFPFLKSGILSAIDSRIKESVIFYIDGQNNPGFSGGPIIYRSMKTSKYHAVAVVSGYRYEGFPVLKKDDLKNLKAEAYQNLHVRGNSGIVVGYSTAHIVDAIRKDATHKSRMPAN